MVTIFIFSGQTGSISSGASNAVGAWVLDILGIEIPEGQTASSVVIFAGLTIRSLAHIFLFSVLGIASFLFVLSLFNLKKKKSKFDILYFALFAFCISFLYACFDELHQLFIDGRTASFRDVGFDSIGFVITILISTCITFLITLLRSRSQLKQFENTEV